MSDRKIYYTADVIIPDGTDTNAYGEPCLEGHGYTIDQGWVSPDYSDAVTFDDQEDVRPDVYDPDSGHGWLDPSPARWLAETVAARLGHCEADTSLGLPRWFRASDDHDRGIDPSLRDNSIVTLAAHPYGFTDREIYVASRMLRLHGYLGSWED